MSGLVPNQFEVNSVDAVSDDESAVSGTVVSGEFRDGDWISLTSPANLPVTGQICALKDGAKTVGVVRADQSPTLHIRVEARQFGEGAILETCEEEVFAPAMLLTQMSPSDRSELPVPPDDLVAIEVLIEKEQYAEAKQALDDRPADPQTYHMIKRLMAKIRLEGGPEFEDAQDALSLILEAYSMRGSADPDVNEVLATALAENGEPVNGLRYLERLYMCALDEEARIYYSELIGTHRVKYGIPDTWEVLDPLGDVLLTATDDGLIAKKFKAGEFPEGAQVRTNRAGELVAIAEFAENVVEIPEVELAIIEDEEEAEAAVSASEETLVVPESEMEAIAAQPAEAAGSGGASLDPKVIALSLLVGANVGVLIGLAAGMSLALPIIVGAFFGGGAGVFIARQKAGKG